MFAGAASTKGNNTSTMLCASTPAVAPPIVFALSSMTQYSMDDLQRIFKTVLDFKLLAPPLALAPASK